MKLSLLYEYLKLLNVNQRAFFHSHYSVKEKEKKKDMILLYKTLIKQKKFQESIIKRKFKEKNLGRLTRRLYDIVEDYMLLFDKKNDKYAEIFLYITKAKKQKELGLTDRSEYLLIKAKQLAEEVEDLNYLAIVLKELSSIYMIKNNTEALENLDISKLPQITTELSLYFSFVKMRIKLIQFSLRKRNENIDDLFNKTELEQLQIERALLNNECFEQQLFLNSTFYALKNEFKKSYSYQLKSLQFYEGWNNRTNFNFTRYNSLLHNTFRSQIKLKEFENAKITLDKLRNLEKTPAYFTNDRITGIYKFRKANCELIYNYHFENYEEILASETDYNETIDFYGAYSSKPNIFTIKFFMGFAFFAIKNYDKASDYFKFLLDDKFIKQRADIEEVSQILYLISIYEINEGSFVKSVLDATMRYFKNKTKYKCDDVVMELIGKLLKPLLDNKSKVKLKSSYKSKIVSLSKLNNLEKERIVELGLLQWL